MFAVPGCLVALDLHGRRYALTDLCPSNLADSVSVLSTSCNRHQASMEVSLGKHVVKTGIS